MKGKLDYHVALQLAEKCCAVLEPYCEQIEVAGSVRRMKKVVGDFEIVCQPKMVVADLFGGKKFLKLPVERLGKIEMGADRYKKIMVPLGDGSGETVQLDLYTVLPPAQWGVIMTLKTGPREFSKLCVTQRSKGGYLPDDLYCVDGSVCKRGDYIETPTEQDFFDLLGLAWVWPWERK